MMGRDVFGKWGECLKILRGGDPAKGWKGCCVWQIK